MKNTSERKHSKYSASGSERWLECPGSVELSEAAPASPDNKYSLEGTEAHGHLETALRELQKGDTKFFGNRALSKNGDMFDAVKKAFNVVKENFDHETEVLHVETRVSLEFIHPEMFGTADVGIIDPWFHRVKVKDYKHGAGKVVETRDSNGQPNSQLMYYLIGFIKKFVGFKKFSEGEIGIIQPRASHISGMNRNLEVPKKKVLEFVEIFKRGVDRAEKKNAPIKVGPWCHWCPAKQYNCPKYEQIEVEKMSAYFND